MAATSSQSYNPSSKPFTLRKFTTDGNKGEENNAAVETAEAAPEQAPSQQEAISVEEALIEVIKGKK